ncbi:trace amine-associated receptor 13c-like [Osmerus mordax]|uniref:trace amine-associated receptor 13c-like n=1 Tax=Osmerus mordax TaxID=8014 RepID=UPI00350F01F7
MEMEHLSEEEYIACYPQVNESCRRQYRSRSESVFIYTLFSSVSLLTVLLNLLVLISISHFRQLHTPTNALVFSLALADLLVGLLVMPVEAIRTVESCWYLGSVVCALNFYSAYILISASLGNLVLISVDRYIAVCKPLLYPSQVTMTRTLVCSTINWACSILYNTWLTFQHLSNPDANNRCFGECVIIVSYINGMVDIVVTFITPCSFIIILYLKIFTVAISQAQSLQARVGCSKSSGEKTWRSERKAARTLGIVVVFFLLCFTPYFCWSFSLDFSSLYFLTWILQFNSFLNPLIYAFFYPWFKRAIKHIFTLKILQTSSSEFKVMPD